MFYFREEELNQLKRFYNGDGKACAVYGRRRVGKTELILQSLKEMPNSIYFQVSGFDYAEALNDFKNALKPVISSNDIVSSLTTFKSLFTYLSETLKTDTIIVIDEFPFLAKKNDDVPAEFQWIIDHGLMHMKLVLIGSNTSFMKSQISDSSEPLYGRFSEIMEILPFSFAEVHRLYPDYDDAMHVYAMTGGVAQYVMFFKEYPTVDEAENTLLFNRNGRLFHEAENLLMQEFRDITSYVSILRAIGQSDKEASVIASKSGISGKIINTYLSKLERLGIISKVNNILSKKKGNVRFKISDLFFRFHYTFIEPNTSMITQIGSKAKPYVLDTVFQEYMGFVYEDVIRNSLFSLALNHDIPFMPKEIGKWWGNIRKDGTWMESEIDAAAVNGRNVLLGECKYRNRKAGIQELESLKMKAGYAVNEASRITYLIASSGGFTDELLNIKETDLVLICKDQVVKKAK